MPYRGAFSAQAQRVSEMLFSSSCKVLEISSFFQNEDLANEQIQSLISAFMELAV